MYARQSLSTFGEVRAATGAGFDRLKLLVFPILALLIWAASLSEIDIRAMNDLGLISVLPPAFFIAITVLAAGFVLALRREESRDYELLLHVLALIIILYATPALVEGTPRFEATWKHMGISEHILNTESINPRFSAYFNWPLFFAGSATFQEIAGLEDLSGAAMWAYLAFNLLYLLPLYVLLRTATVDRRLVWLGIWFFYLANWVGQDYFSPQGFAFILYLATLAILLRWFSGRLAGPGVQALSWAQRAIRKLAPRALDYRPRHINQNVEAVEDTTAQRIGAFLVLIAGFGAMVPSHQLTPFAALFCVMALVGLGLAPVRGLVPIMVVVLSFWMAFVAVPYFTGHLEGHLSSVGQLNQNIDQGVTQRAANGSDDHRLIVRTRLIFSGAIVTLGLLGGLRRILNRQWDLSMACLVAAPPLLVAVQGYGGEIFLRIFFYSLPALAFFVGALFLPRRATRMNWRVSLLILATSVIVATGSITARYGNERMDFFSPQEIAAIEYFYDTAEPGSVLLSGSNNLPWRSEGFTSYGYNTIKGSTLLEQDLDAVVADIRRRRENGRETYLVLTRSSGAQRDMFVEPGILDRFEDLVRSSGRFTAIFTNSDATIYVLNSGGEHSASDEPASP